MVLIADAKLMHSNLNFSLRTHVLAEIITELDAILPCFTRSHPALAELHDNVSRLVVLYCRIVGQVRSNSCRASDSSSEVAIDVTILVEVKCIAEDERLCSWINSSLLVSINDHVANLVLIS